MKKDPTSLSFGVGTSIGGIAHIAGALGLAAAGVDITKMKAVVFNSSSDAMTAVLGGHLDVAISFVNVDLADGRNRQDAPARRDLAGASARRAGEHAVVEGTRFDAVVLNWRMLMGPKDMPADQLAYWKKVSTALVETPEFKQDLRNNGQDGDDRESRWLRSSPTRSASSRWCSKPSA